MKGLIYSLIIILSITSCTKIIDVDLKNADSKVVIEATMLHGINDFEVKISKTGDYFSGDASQKLTGALVNIFDGTNTQTVTEIGNGVYRIPSYIATSNTTYTLTVNIEGETYEAISTMPEVIKLDTLGYEFQPASAFNDSGYFAFFVFNDPINIRNYYRGTVTVNGEFTKGVDDLYIFDDALIDGNLIIIPVFGEIYQAGDVLNATLYSLNATNYKYYETLEDIMSGLNGGENAAPYNPDNNWSNGALGNFTTAATSSFSGIVR